MIEYKDCPIASCNLCHEPKRIAPNTSICCQCAYEQYFEWHAVRIPIPEYSMLPMVLSESEAAAFNKILARPRAQVTTGFETTENLYEMATDEHGSLLWYERYIFKRMQKVGDTFIRDYINWKVLECDMTEGVLCTKLKHCGDTRNTRTRG